MTLKGHYAFGFKTRASLGAHYENLNGDRPILSATEIATVTLGSDNIDLCGYLQGFPGDEASDDSGVIVNKQLIARSLYFHGFWTLRLWHLRK